MYEQILKTGDTLYYKEHFHIRINSVKQLSPAGTVRHIAIICDVLNAISNVIPCRSM